jgi:two-component system, OmpR family, sensor histidine kinase ArlS
MNMSGKSISIRTRMLIFNVVWLVIVLMMFNGFVYHFFMKQTTDSEIKQLWNRAQIILRKPEVKQTWHWQDSRLLEEFLTPQSMIRIVRPDGSIAASVHNNKDLLLHSPVYRNYYHTAITNEGGSRKLYIQVPIMWNGEQVGLLEIGRAMSVLSDYLEVLWTALSLTTLSAIVFAIVGGYFFTKHIIKPLSEMIETMQFIETSGVFMRIRADDLSSQHSELGQLMDTFNRMIDRLEQNDVKQRQFLQDASHELRTPLTIIESYSGMLKRWAADDQELRMESIDAIYSESIRLKHLISSLLATARGERERLLNKQKVNLVELIQQTAHRLERSFHRDIIVEASSEPIQGWVDPEKLRQLMIILLDNALKYSHSPVKVVLTKLDEDIQIECIDQGIGIPQKDIPFLFERFYRVDQARSRQTGGTGLGLTIAQSIVYEHGGSITVQSEQGKGTMVTVTLPLKLLTEFSE